MRVMFRSRQPVVVDGRHGFADLWTRDEARAREHAGAAPGRIFETVTEESLDDPARFSAGQRAKALQALAAAYSVT